jgi:6-pyruvoyltetrahydropterin/6-carboxytetrahydropterin synthase
MTLEISKSFSFDAAHQLASNVEAGHRYARVHGHSFAVTLAFSGTPDPATGWIRDFAEIDAFVQTLRSRLDHHYLNDIEGLEQPTLERLAVWIWDQTKPSLPELMRVSLQRGSCGEGCIYSGS